MDCIFCKIIKQELPADIVYQDEFLMAFKDIKPKADVHILIVPKKHIASIIALEAAEKSLLGEMVWRAKQIADQQGLGQTGYKLCFNVGRGGGQIVDHLHLHVLGGNVKGGVPV